MSNPPKKLTVTAVSANGSDSITAFFNEFPGVVVQGNSMEDVKIKLSSLLDSYIERLAAMKNNIEIQESIL